MYSQLGGGPMCGVCSKPVYFNERVLVAGSVYHKTCFRCMECHKTLTLGQQNTHKSEFYCNTCYTKKFGPYGYGFGVGAGVLTESGKRLNRKPSVLSAIPIPKPVKKAFSRLRGSSRISRKSHKSETRSQSRNSNPSTTSTIPSITPEVLEEEGDSKHELSEKEADSTPTLSDDQDNLTPKLSDDEADSTPEKVYDFCIVGGGFSGAYMAYRLSKEHPGKSVVLLEKEATIGGRLMSDDNDDDNESNKDELGGMRIFPSAHLEVAKLIQDVGCSMVPVKLSDENNIFFADGVHTEKGKVVLDESMGRSPSQMVADCVASFHQLHPDQVPVDPYESEVLRHLSPREFLSKFGATDLEIERWVTYSGYDIFSDDNVSASIFVKEGVLYGAKLSNDQKYVKEGYQEVVRRMVREAQRGGLEVRMQCSAHDIVPPAALGAAVVHVQSSDGRSDSIAARQVVLGLPKDTLEKLVESSQAANFMGDLRYSVLDDVMIIPLFKCFMEWTRVPGEEQWWVRHGFTHGKSTTDLAVRQIHAYDHEDILVYNSGKYADEWNEKFTADPRAAAREVLAMIKAVYAHVEDMPQPDWDSTIFKYWANGSHKWKKRVDILSRAKLIAGGLTENTADNFLYICGDAYSTHQGWTMGCIETVQYCWDAMEARGVFS